MIEFKLILCPIDFSSHSEHALQYAMRIASWYTAPLHVMHVMAPLPPSTINPLGEAGRQLTASNLTAAIARWREPGVVVTSELLESGDPAGRIIERAEALDVDLVIMGSHGRKGLQRLLLGSVVEPMLHKCRRPVLVIPAGLNLKSLTRPVSFKRIVCAVDFAAPSLAALAHAMSLAEEADGLLTLLNVVDKPPELTSPPPPPDFDIDVVRAEAEADRLRQLRALVPEHARDYCTVETAVIEGGVSRQVLRVAEARLADLIVLGVHGRSNLDLAVFGSNAKDVITRAHCPVLIVPVGRRASLRAAS